MKTSKARKKKVKQEEQPIEQPVEKQPEPQQEEQQEQIHFTKEELENLLIELSSTRYWLAIMAYYGGLETIAVQSLRSVDAFKEPTEVARKQGFLSALPYLSDYVNMVKEERRKKENKTDDENVSLGYGN
jgi:hypothetical protein